MATKIEMPRMGFDMKEGTLVRWRKKEGDQVARGEVIAEIETDKATVDMEAYASGVLSKIVVEEGTTVPVGELIAVIGEPGEAVPDVGEVKTKAPSKAAAPDKPAPAAPAKEPARAVVTSNGAKDIRATPVARRMAKEMGIDLAQITGTGPGGRITEADVRAQDGAPKEAAAALKPTITPVAAGGRVELTKMRQAIARITVQSKRESPHFYVTSEVDMTQAMAVRKQLNEEPQDGTKISVNDMIIKAAAKALIAFPKFNATFQEDYLQLNASVNIGLAIALEQGLIVAAIEGCQDKSLIELAKASKDLVRRAQGGTLRAEEYTGSTFTISNLGMFDVESFAAVIFPPNAAVLAVGTVKEQPVVRNGQITIAQVMKATISVDHRVADGAEGARFLSEVKKHLENPVTLWV